MSKDTRKYVAETRALDGLAPLFRLQVESVVLNLTKRGFDPFVFETLRVAERQWWIYGCGRSVEQCIAAGVPKMYAWSGGRIVTSASSHLKSVHGHGLAVDIISKSKMWDAPTAFWAALGEAAEALGLTWGGRWQHPHDVPHIQWSLRRGGSVYAGPSQADRERTLREGRAATWKVYGAAA
jgi:hypothetical protein